MNTQNNENIPKDSLNMLRYKDIGIDAFSYQMDKIAIMEILTDTSDRKSQSDKIRKMDQIPGLTLHEMRVEYSRNELLLNRLVDIKNNVKFKKRTFL